MNQPTTLSCPGCFLSVGTALLITAALAVQPAIANTTFTGTGANPAGVQPTVDAFRAAVGDPNNGANNPPGTIPPGGRREINWDAGGLPVAMPADFFNLNSRRGAVFSTGGSGFQVSVNLAADPTSRFGNVDPSYAAEFITFSANRLFAAAGSPELDVHFFHPNHPTIPAVVSSFGAVFSDVDLVGITKLELFDLDNNLVGSATAGPLDKGLSFLGLVLDPGVFAARAHITSGNLALGAGNVDGPGFDVVAMDDFIFGEPQMVPETSTWLGGGALAALAGFAAWRRRGQAGR